MTFLAALMAMAAFGQDLSLSDAVAMAQKQHAAIAAARLRTQAAAHRIAQARAGYLPQVDYSESYQRGNNPVYVFGTLLTQRRFAESNFRLDSLNNPASVQNFQSQVGVSQTIYNGGATRLQVQSADLERKLSMETERATANDLGVNAARAYLALQLAAERLKVAAESLRSAEASLERATNLRNAGMTTDADVLSIQVHVAAMQEQQIRSRLDADVAQAAFNEAVGAPLDNRWNLTTPLAVLAAPSRDRGALERQAVSARPDARQAGLAIELTDTQRRLARTGYFPQISVRALLEADRNKFATQGGGNWFIAGGLRWNLFDGFKTRQQVKMAEAQLEAAKAGKRQLEAAVQLGVRRAHAEVNAATERIAVSQAAIAQAEESLRITRNRYEAGLSSVTDLIRNEVALLEARLRRLMAIHDQRAAAVMLEYAAGDLQPGSEVLR